jgi:hypothetical protein
MDELGWNHVLKELVGHLRARDDGAHGKTRLGIVENVADQERLTRVLLSNHDHHRTLARIHLASVLKHPNIKLPEVEVHRHQTTVIQGHETNRRLYFAIP